MSTKSKIRTTIELNSGDKEKLQRLALDLLIIQPTGPNARQAGSISQLMQDIASGEVILYRPSNNLRRPGIYSITNTITGKRYIGSSNNIYVRIGSHKTSLASGKGITKELQKDYDKYGANAFLYSAIEFVDGSEFDLEIREHCHIVDAYRSISGCYNTKNTTEKPSIIYPKKL